MGLTKSLLILAVVSLFVFDVRAKLKGDDCEGTYMPASEQITPKFNLLCASA